MAYNTRAKICPRQYARVLAVSLFVVSLVLGVVLLAPTRAVAETSFSITGRGFGHGVGMSQYGAKGFAENGYTYDYITSHYYQGTSIGTVANETIKVNVDKYHKPRTSWTLRAGNLGALLSVNGVVAPADKSYRFVPIAGRIAVYDGITLWRDFTAPVTVLETPIALLGPGLAEETHPAIGYGGQWHDDTSGAVSGGTYTYSYTAGSTTALRFVGTKVTWIGVEGPSYGKAEVWLDGKLVETLSLYETTYDYLHPVWASEVLAQTEHTLEIRVLGTKEDSSTGTTVIVDAFSVEGGVQPESSSGTSLVQVVDQSGPLYSSSNPDGAPYVRYRGSMMLRLEGLKLELVNAVALEDYLKGVVPRESPASWPSDALKAQAVAARSYAYVDSYGVFTAMWCNTMDQTYAGHSYAPDRTNPTTVYEDSRTNAVIAATTGQVVKYGSTVVKTYYSTSSGGHTANSEDVWSAVEPYYTGVPDPYEASASPAVGSPWALSWGEPLIYSGSELAAKLGYSSDVIGVSTDTASSGHVRSVIVKLASGASYELRGETFKNRLGLKSTVFQFGVKGPLVIPAGMARFRYEDADSRIAYSLDWHSGASASTSGGSYHYGYKAGATAALSFSGTDVAWIGSYGPSYGKAEVWLDGVKVDTVDTYASSYAHRQVLWSRTGLANTTHTLEIKVLGTKNVLSTGAVVIFDAIDLGPTYYEDSDPAVTYDGTWVSGTSAAASGGDYHYSYSAGSKAKLSFSGTDVVTLIGSYGPSYGKAEVWLDGVKVDTVDTYASSYAYQQVLWSKTGLADTTHTLEIRVLGTYEYRSSGAVVVVDAIDLSPICYEDSDPVVTYAGKWGSGTSAAASGGDYHYSYTAGSKAKLSFADTEVAWIGSYGPSYGKAEVWLDGVKVDTVDTYASSYAYEQWSSMPSTCKTSLRPRRLRRDLPSTRILTSL